MKRRVTFAVLASMCAACSSAPPTALNVQRMIEAGNVGGRPMSGRLAHAAHASPRSPVRAAESPPRSASLDVLRHAAEFQQAVARDPSAENLHALGVSFLLLGEPLKAVQLLQDSVREAPSANGWNDLSVVYLELATAQRPDVLPQAIEASDQALSIDPSSAEARFNLALALERLHLNQEASAAWRSALSVAQSDAWRLEGTDHARALEHSLAAARERIQLASRAEPLWKAPNDLRALFLAERDAGVRDTSAFDVIEHQALPLWGQAVERGDARRASALLGAVQDLLEAGIGGGARGEFSRIVSQCARPGQRHLTASGLRAYGQGISDLNENRIEAAASRFAAASAFFRSHCDVLFLWAETQRAWADYSGRMYDAARRRFGSVITAAKHGRFNRVLASAQRGYAMTELAEQQNARALEDLQSALESARLSGDLILTGRLLNNLADALDFEGRRRESWIARVEALELASRFSVNALTLSVYGSAEWTAAREHQTRLALAFVAAEDAASGSKDSTLTRMIREARRAELSVTRKDYKAARESLDHADRLLALLADDPRATTLAALPAGPRAQVIAETEGPAQAIQTLDRALAALNGRVPSRAARLRLTRATLLASLNDAENAVRDLRTAVRLFEETRGASVADVFDASATRELLQVARNLVDVLLARGMADRALEIWTEVRAALDGEDVYSLPAVPSDVALVQYLVLANRIVGWLTVHGQSRTLDIKLADVRRAKSRLETAVLRGGARADLDDSFQELHRLLIDPIAPQIAGVSRLIVVPDGLLLALPFGSFRNPATRRYLFETMTVDMAWNLPRLTEPEMTRDSHYAVVVSDPGLPATNVPLPSARAEAESIARLYPSSLLLGSDAATVRRLLVELPRATVVHWAGHAVVDESDGRGSYLPIAPEPGASDRLTPATISGLRMRPGSIVVLAACRSVETPYRALNPRSLAHAFHRAGAGRVIGVMWDIPDAASREFFEALHRELLLGHPASEGLRTVQRVFAARNSTAATVALAASSYIR